MKYNFLGFNNWEPRSGQLNLQQAFDVFRASESSSLPRDICEECVCWRVFGTCMQVQVDALEEDRMMREDYKRRYGDDYELPTGCLISRNCCPILFFDFIGIKLPVLDTESVA